MSKGCLNRIIALWLVVMLALLQASFAVFADSGEGVDNIFSEEQSGAQQNEADANLPDGEDGDSGLPDGEDADSGLPDGEDADSGLPDGEDADAGLPDGEDADSGLPDGEDADSGLPDGEDEDSGLPDGEDEEAGLPDIEGEGELEFEEEPPSAIQVVYGVPLPFGVYVDGDHTFTTDDTGGKIILTGYTGPGGDITIPDGVTDLADSVFENNATITGVTIPGSVESIGSSAFSWCTQLESITIPASVKSIGSSAFSWCLGLRSVEFEQGSQLASIERGLFSCCRELTSITVPASVTSIDASAFWTDANTGDGQPAYSRLTHINVENGNNFFSSIDGVLYNKDRTEIIFYAPARSSGSGIYEIPDGVIRIAPHCFFISTLKKIIVPKSVEIVGLYAFANSKELEVIEFPVDSNLTELGSLCISNSPKLVLFLPPSLPETNISLIFSAFGEDSRPRNEVVFFVFYDSEVAQWCRDIGYLYALRPSSAEMQANPPELMHEYIPYQFTTKTLVPGNAGLFFWLEDMAGNPISLPEGLKLADGGSSDNSGLTPGTIYGSPLNYEPFVNGIEFVMRAQHEDDRGGLFTAWAEFQIKLAPRPNNQELEAINKFVFIATPEYGDGKIDEVITGKSEEYNTPQVLYISGDYGLFDSLWINGIKKERDTDYTADDGSTRITIAAMTIRNLDNGEYTAAAAFRRGDGAGSNDTNSDLDVVAQNFTVNFADEPTPPPPDPPDSPAPLDPSDTNDSPGSYSGNRDRFSRSGNAGYQPASSPLPTADSQSDDTPQEDTGTVPGEEAGGQDSGNAVQNEGSGGRESGNAVPGEGSGERDSGNAVQDEESDEQDSGNTEPDMVEGLLKDENGNYYFNLDGSGTPMIMRIDIPLEEFRGLLFDGVLWEQGTDYTASSGSTILSVTAARMEELEEGSHTLEAIFEKQAVKITFALRRAAAEKTPDRQPSLSKGVPTAESVESAARSLLPLISGIAVILLLTAIVIWRVKVRRREGYAK